MIVGKRPTAGALEPSPALNTDSAHTSTGSGILLEHEAIQKKGEPVAATAVPAQHQPCADAASAAVLVNGVPFKVFAR